MSFSLSTLVFGHTHRFVPRSPPSRQKLYFPPGGRTHDRHIIPSDQLHISLSDPVLVAAEQRLASNAPGKKQHKRSIINDAGTKLKTARSGHIVLHLRDTKACLLQTSSVRDSASPVTETVSPRTMATNTQGTHPGYGGTAGSPGGPTLGANMLDPLDQSCDISEVMTIENAIDGLPGNTNGSGSENSSGLAPLASDTFKEELYIRGYLKRPPSRPSNVARKLRPSLLLVSRKVFPKVLGRRQGRKVAESLRATQNAAETSGGLVKHTLEKQLSTSVASVMPQVVDGLDSPGTDSTTSISDSCDLHEFSYITAFTTPPSSPSVVLDAAEALRKGVNLGDSKHAV